MHYQNRKIKLKNTRISPMGRQLETFQPVKSKNALKASQSPKIKITQQRHRKSTSRGKPQSIYENKENQPPLINVNLSEAHLMRQLNNYTLNSSHLGETRKKIQSLNKNSNSLPKSHPPSPIMHRKDLKRCQVHEQNQLNQIPSARYLVEQSFGEFLCCQQCLMIVAKTAKVTQIPPRQNVKSSLGSLKPSKQGFSQIIMRMSYLQTVKQNAEKYQDLINDITKRQLDRHSQYYDSIVLFIRECEKQSQDILTKISNQNQQKLRKVLNQVETSLSVLKSTNMQVMQMCALNKSSNWDHVQDICQSAIEKLDFSDDKLRLDLPILTVHLDSLAIQRFMKVFDKEFRIKWVNKFEQSVQNNVNKSFMESLQNSLKAHDSQQNCKPNLNSKHYSTSKHKHQQGLLGSSQMSNSDLLCNESIDFCLSDCNMRDTNKPKCRGMLFSFERDPFEFVVPQQIQQQFSQQEAVVSPVFKQF